jgi:hypothetical protein
VDFCGFVTLAEGWGYASEEIKCLSATWCNLVQFDATGGWNWGPSAEGIWQRKCVAKYGASDAGGEGNG